VFTYSHSRSQPRVYLQLQPFTAPASTITISKFKFTNKNVLNYRVV
jgi:hypothetical protein